MSNYRIIVNTYCILLFCYVWRWSQADLYTAITDLEPLLVTYKRFIDDLDDYLKKEEERISVLKKYLNIYNKEQNAAIKDIPNYVGNPINAFTLIKRLTMDLTDIGQRMENSSGPIIPSVYCAIPSGWIYHRYIVPKLPLCDKRIVRCPLPNVNVNSVAARRFYEFCAPMLYNKIIPDISRTMKLGNQQFKKFLVEILLTMNYESIEEYIKNISMIHQGYLYPTNEDLKGAVLALARVQETYLLNVTDLSEGILNGIQYSSPMTASDCYEIGKVLFLEENNENSLAWMLEALRKHRKNPHEAGVNSYSEVFILEFISYTYYLLNDIHSALKWTAPLLALEPNHPRVTVNVPQYEVLLKEQEKNKSIEFRQKMVIKDPHEPTSWNSMTTTKKYEKLCRGEMMLSSKVSKQLTCRYLTENHPFLRLAPIKIEQHYMKPDIFLVHDAMSDYEIEVFKDMAKPRLQRAEVIDPKTGKLYSVTYRINKISWLKDTENKLVARVSQRLSDFTGMTMSTAEELQVSIYGMGGHYEPHLDFARSGEALIPGFIGNRMATVIFYMSDVEQGGATVFTELGLSVFPVKNAALFWSNLHPSCEGDFATRHAACPVLKGYKWVSTKWIHQGGQEFLKPCQLEYQKEGIIRKLSQPVPKT